MPPSTLRRNGKVPSCEPCRKSKLSCDHETPICGRCRRRKITDRCTYHPAPMTSRRATNDISDPGESRHWSSFPSDPAKSPITPSSTSRESEGEKLSSDVYLGSTSYSAVFTEGQNRIQFQDVEDPDDERHLALAACQARLKFGLSPAKFQEGVEVLSLLSDMKKYEVALARWYKVQCLAAFLPFVGECISRAAQSSNTTSQSKASLLKQSEQVFVNTSNDLVIQSTTTMQDLPAMLTGENLRWDIVGLMLSTAGLSAIAMDVVNINPEDDELDINWKDMARGLLMAGDKCISFCEAVDSLNDVTVWMIMMNYILHTQVEGDADAICWRKQGGLTTAIFALGLHQEPREPVRTPWFLVQMRRTTFWFAYICDKNFATFLGRPPMINSNFCYRQLPLDLEPTDLSIQGRELQDVLGKLNANGWNEENRVGRFTWLRTSIMCCKFREEILEISLGSNTFGLFDRAHEILRRQKEAYEAFPAILRDRSDRWILERSTAENYFQLSKHMDPIYNEFLLHRALVKRLRIDPADLIRAARSVLSPLLILCENRHRQGFYANDLPWLIALYGLPPAGVLALELLQQLSDRGHTPDPDFPRSDIIQKLCILISSIGSIVHPTNGNYGICSQAKKMLQAILDTVLAPTSVPAPAPEPANHVNGAQQQQYGILETGAQNHEADVTLDKNQMWFDNTDFDIDFWNNLEDHPLLTWPEVA